jgi:hypothetical protein
MLWVVLQQGELFVGTSPYVGGQGAVVVRKSAFARWTITRPLKRLSVSGPVVGQGAIDPAVYAPRIKIGFELRVDRLRAVLVQP